MGTLGCINNMMRRDKENRELRNRNRERMKETHTFMSFLPSEANGRL
ncbi:hypothetical protein [uncultured Bacteroides sp.]|nr:hypothetical protein [uncultured Bacteroides sp.]